MELSKQFPGGTDKNQEDLSNDSLLPGTQFMGVLNIKQKCTLEAEKYVACNRTYNFNHPTSEVSV
jgi:hypothetical protein